MIIIRIVERIQLVLVFTGINHGVYAGHRTSIILEEDFWDALEECAHDRELCIDSIVTDAEKAFPEMSRTAAVRMFLLEHFRTKAEDTDPIH